MAASKTAFACCFFKLDGSIWRLRVAVGAINTVLADVDVMKWEVYIEKGGSMLDLNVTAPVKRQTGRRGWSFEKEETMEGPISDSVHCRDLLHTDAEANRC